MKFRWLAVALLDLRSDPPPSLILTFILGGLSFAVWGNGLFSLFTDVDTGIALFFRALLGGAVGFGLGAIAFFVYWRGITVNIKLSEKSTVPKKRYVITALSPFSVRPDGNDNLGVIRDIIAWHGLSQDSEKQLHLISVLQVDPDTGAEFAVNPHDPSNQAVAQAYQRLKTEYSNTLLHIELHGIYNTDSAEQSFDAASKTLSELNDLENSVIDVTAGTKAMTAGLAAAAFASGCPLTYLATPRDSNGEPDFTAKEKKFIFLDSGNLRTQIMRNASEKT
ncbi:MAG: hypothetical protein IPO91_29250 [Chloroflexi bacterium]|nr:hypothetical protein [Chloroflexota bacterium]